MHKAFGFDRQNVAACRGQPSQRRLSILRAPYQHYTYPGKDKGTLGWKHGCACLVRRCLGNAHASRISERLDALLRMVLVQEHEITTGLGLFGIGFPCEIVTIA